MQKNIIDSLNRYIEIFKDETNSFDFLNYQILNNQDLISRNNTEGHVTANALIINKNKKVLVVFHNKLKKFLQPGGHIESDDVDIKDSARREVLEETGISEIELHNWCLDNNCPILIDTHKIPENIKKNEPEHYHHDFMFIYQTNSDHVNMDTEEVSDFKWVEINEILNDNSNVSIALRRMNKMGLL